mmetsp:Transcript_15580/g.18768  ORF Transcript_15580/g.18768 Transcript_15580/m.18768 type:complete len:85 (-) Transcript_15580:80-334(-)
MIETTLLPGDVKIAKDFIGNSGSRTLFYIQPNSAVSIQKFSAFKGEDEYVIPPGRFFKVQKSRKQPTGLVIIYIEELSKKSLVT